MGYATESEFWSFFIHDTYMPNQKVIMLETYLKKKTKWQIRLVGAVM